MGNDPGPSNKTPAKPEKPARSKLERAIVWTLIGLLIVFVAVEAVSKNGYEKTLANLQDAIDTATEPVTMDTFHNSLKRGVAIQGTGDKDGVQTILFTWPSLIKTYQMHLTVSPDEAQTLITYATGEDPAAGVPQPRPAGEDSEAPDSDAGGGGGPSAHGEVGSGPAPGGGGPGPGGGGQGGAQRGGRNPLQRLLSEPVLAELQVTEEQKTQITELIESQQLAPMLSPEERAEQQAAQRKEVEKQLKDLLNEEQFARARQILLHARGLEALAEEEIAQELGLTSEQNEQIAAILAGQREQQQALFQQVQDGEIEQGAIREKMAALREDVGKQLLAVLTDEQKQAWEALLGPAPPEPERGNRPQRPE